MKAKMAGILAGLMLGMTAALPVLAAAPDAKEVAALTRELTKLGGAVQPIGDINPYGNAKTFTGQSYLANVSADKNLPVLNVTFAHGAHTFWHRHNGSCQILVAESGVGYYQIWGEAPHKLLPGQTATIPAGVKHWHGAAPGRSFQHIALMERKPGITTDWLEEVDSRQFNALDNTAK